MKNEASVDDSDIDTRGFSGQISIEESYYRIFLQFQSSVLTGLLKVNSVW